MLDRRSLPRETPYWVGQDILPHVLSHRTQYDRPNKVGEVTSCKDYH